MAQKPSKVWSLDVKLSTENPPLQLYVRIHTHSTCKHTRTHKHNMLTPRTHKHSRHTRKHAHNSPSTHTRLQSKRLATSTVCVRNNAFELISPTGCNARAAPTPFNSVEGQNQKLLVSYKTLAPHRRQKIGCVCCTACPFTPSTSILSIHSKPA